MYKGIISYLSTWSYSILSRLHISLPFLGVGEGLAHLPSFRIDISTNAMPPVSFFWRLPMLFGSCGNKFVHLAKGARITIALTTLTGACRIDSQKLEERCLWCRYICVVAKWLTKISLRIQFNRKQPKVPQKQRWLKALNNYLKVTPRSY